MPKLTKNAFSRFIRTDCQRQLRLLLASNQERTVENMPDKQQPRPGLAAVANLGIDWQHDKVTDLQQVFGANSVVADPRVGAGGRIRYESINLDASLTQAAAWVPASQPSVWLVEAEYEVGARFQSTLAIDQFAAQYGLTYSRLRPDLIEVLPPMTYLTSIDSRGEITTLAGPDDRLQLRVIDIKLTAEPSAAYFAEVVLYSMVLAGWLSDAGRDSEFVVVPDGALWPGSHDASNLTVQANEYAANGVTPTSQQLRDALAGDLEEVPFEVFAPRVRSFFQEDLPEVLAHPWTDLNWHVDNRCKGCDFLGGPWLDSNGQPTADSRHCVPQAERDAHLSQVPFVSRGAGVALRQGGVPNVTELATRPANDPVLSRHQVLRGTRTVITRRASVLDQQGAASVAPNSGTSAVMPRWSDLRVHLSTDFDPGTAITFSFGVSGFWIEPRPYGQGQGTPRTTEAFAPAAFIVERRDVSAEEIQLLAFLRHIDAILTHAFVQDSSSTIQFYIWDRLEQKHLARVVGRHLQAVLASGDVDHLAWLFPPQEVVPNPRHATRRSPTTIVRDVVRSVVAAPVAHYYSLLEVARHYHEASLPPNVANFSVHPLFEDPLSDQIPPERAHEIWTRSSQPPWQQTVGTLEETVSKRLRALETVRRRLEDDLGATLGQTAAPIEIGALAPAGRMAFDSELWLAYAKLDAALDELDVAQARAMPPHEREAKFRAARLERRLHGQEEANALQVLGVAPAPGRRVYKMRPESREVKLKEGEFNVALSPENPPGFLDQSLRSVLSNTALAGQTPGRPVRMEDIAAATVVALDRDNLTIVLQIDGFWSNLLQAPTVDDLEQAQIIDLDRDAVLDPVHKDFFTSKLKATLQAVGNPPIAGSNLAVRLATGALARRGANPTPHTPVADFLWDAAAMHAQTVGRNLGPVRVALEQGGVSLNSSQWAAWERALSCRLQPIWGPPGTGKSRTMRTVALGAAVAAAQAGEPIRILIASATFTAIDNVVVKVEGMLNQLLPGANVEVHRLRSAQREPATGLSPSADRVIDKHSPDQAQQDLMTRLDSAAGITVVAATPQQLFNMLTAGQRSPQQERFDLILVDEASQIDVANSILAIASLAARGSVVTAGDPKQLPPIHQAVPPTGLEAMVGSTYEFVTTIHGVPEAALEENYRSNDTVVEFARRGGYAASLQAVAPDLELGLAAPGQQPASWPQHLFWTAEWDAVLDSNQPAVAFVYDDQAWSSQWNHFEADAVAALAVRLRERMQRELLNRVDPVTGQPEPAGQPQTIDDIRFWSQGLGIVTPHRAQQGLVMTALQKAFPQVPPAMMRDSVDTVERFQGQERDVMIATFALGDPDAISEEDEFLLGFNRFNVITSRARAKLIVLVSEQVVEHLSDDVDVLRDSSLLKMYAQSFCDQHRAMTLGKVDETGAPVAVEGEFCWHG